jgi:hypothetical protein
MLIRRQKNKKAFSTMEYFVLMVILMTALMAFKEPLLRAIAGKWKGAGDQFGFGRQYHPTDTVECAYDNLYAQGWYDVTCYENKRCPLGNDSCQRQAINQCIDEFCNANSVYDIE